MTEKQAVEISAWFSLFFWSWLFMTWPFLLLMSEFQVRVVLLSAVGGSGFFGWRLGRLGTTNSVADDRAPLVIRDYR